MSLRMMILGVGDSLSPSLLLSLSPSLSSLHPPGFFGLDILLLQRRHCIWRSSLPSRYVCISEPSSSLVSYGSPLSTLTHFCSGVRFFFFFFSFSQKDNRKGGHGAGGLPLVVFCKNNNSLSLLFTKKAVYKGFEPQFPFHPMFFFSSGNYICSFGWGKKKVNTSERLGVCHLNFPSPPQPLDNRMIRIPNALDCH